MKLVSDIQRGPETLLFLMLTIEIFHCGRDRGSWCGCSLSTALRGHVRLCILSVGGDRLTNAWPSKREEDIEGTGAEQEQPWYFMED